MKIIVITLKCIVSIDWIKFRDNIKLPLMINIELEEEIGLMVDLYTNCVNTAIKDSKITTYYSDVRAERNDIWKETKDSGYATRGPREKLAQVTGKPTVTGCLPQRMLREKSNNIGDSTASS